MINALPYAVIAIAMFIHKDRTNLAAVGVFAFFYSLALIINHSFEGRPEYFIWSIVSTPLFLIAMSMMTKITRMIAILCLTEIVLLLIDVVSLMAYNVGIEWAYQSMKVLGVAIVALQLSALLVRHGTGNSKLRQSYGNMVMRPGELLRRALYR